MSPELQKELAAWLASMRETAHQGANFALEQAPLLIQEKVWYGRVSSVFLVIVALGALTLCVRWLRQGIVVSQAAEHNSYDIWLEREGGLQCLCSATGCVVAACVALVNANTAITAWVAPRLYIVEWLAGLLK